MRQSNGRMEGEYIQRTVSWVLGELNLFFIITLRVHTLDEMAIPIETNFFSVKPPIEQKLNYDKGDYAALRS